MEKITIEVPKVGAISDGYHTFDELYEHRITLYIALCKQIASYWDAECAPNPVWRSQKHSDGSNIEGWFVLGLYQDNNSQITYHLPNDRWDETEFAVSLEKAPDFDGHTSADVLERIKSL